MVHRSTLVSAQGSLDGEVFQGLSRRVPTSGLPHSKPQAMGPHSVVRADTVNVRDPQETQLGSSRMSSSLSSVGGKNGGGRNLTTQIQRSTQISRLDNGMPRIVEERTGSLRSGIPSTRSSSQSARLGPGRVASSDRETKPLPLRRKPSIIADFVSQSRATPDSRQPTSEELAERDMTHVMLEDGPSPSEMSIAGGTDSTTEFAVTINTSQETVDEIPSIRSMRSVTPSTRYTSSPSVFSQAPTLTSRTSYSPISTRSGHSGPVFPTWSSPVPSLDECGQSYSAQVTGKRPPTATRQPLGRSIPRRDSASATSPESIRAAGSMNGASQRSSGNTPTSTLPKFSAKSKSSPARKLPKTFSTASKPGENPYSASPPELAHLLFEPLNISATTSSQAQNLNSDATDVLQSQKPPIEPFGTLQLSPYDKDQIDSLLITESRIGSHALHPVQPVSKRGRSSAPPPTAHTTSTLSKPQEARTTPTRSNNTPTPNSHSALRVKNSKSRMPLSCIWRRDKASEEPAGGEQPDHSSEKVIKVHDNGSKHRDSPSGSIYPSSRVGRSVSRSSLEPWTRPGNSIQEPPLDDFLSKRLQPVYIRGTAALDGEFSASRIAKSRSTGSTSKDKPQPVDSGNPQPMGTAGMQRQVNNKATSSTAIQERDRPIHHPVRSSVQSQVKLHIDHNHNDLSRQSQGQDNTTLRTEKQLKPKRSHWSVFQRESKPKPLEKKSFLQRALGLAVKHTSNGIVPATENAASPPKGENSQTKAVQQAINTPLAQSLPKEFETVEMSPYLVQRNSEDQARPQRPLQNVLPRMRRSEELPRRGFYPSRTSSNPLIARQMVVDAVSLLGSPASLPRRSVESVRSEAQSDGWLEPSSRHQSKDAPYPQQTTRSERPFTSITQTELPLSQDFWQKSSTEVQASGAGYDLPRINTSSVVRQKPSKNNLERVLEEEFLTFSACRDSGSSYSGNSGTFYFPLAPSHAPRGSLPKLPDSATSSDMKLSKIAKRIAPSNDSDATASDVDWMSQVIFQDSDATRSTVPRGQNDYTNHKNPRAKDGHLQSSVLRIDSTKRRNSGLPRPVGSQTSSKSYHTMLQGSGKTSMTDSSIASQVKETQRPKESLSAANTPARLKMASANAMSMADLRFASLMTSRWLSFGRVLFSPAHTDLKDPSEDRILVIDGLGKDWSYYCALTYPNAQVHTLSLSSNTYPPTLRPTRQRTLPNHREVSHPDLITPFPFPKSYFAATVFRFPVATTDTALKFAISECTRVLRPGGYIEISALDLDLALMGTHARRSVRELKMRIHAAAPDTSLKPASDNMQRLLGRSGFEKLNRCVIGMPAVGSVAGSRANSLDERTHSFRDLVKDESERSDEGIAKMVSKVGRWWYTQCYEGGDVEHSIWNEKLLLKECEELQTTFKLLICYAQKPMVPKRRATSL